MEAVVTADAITGCVLCGRVLDTRHILRSVERLVLDQCILDSFTW